MGLCLIGHHPVLLMGGDFQRLGPERDFHTRVPAPSMAVVYDYLLINSSTSPSRVAVSTPPH